MVHAARRTRTHNGNTTESVDGVQVCPTPSKGLPPTASKNHSQSQTEHEGPATALEGDQQDPQDGAKKRYTYRAPRCDGSSATGTTEYTVDRTPDEVAQSLLSSLKDEDEGGGGGDGEGGGEGDETGSATDEENEEKEAEGEGQEKEGDPAGTAGTAAAAAAGGGDGKKPGSSGVGKGKGKGGAASAEASAAAAASAVADLPSYWRGRFAPLDSDGLQALEIENGEDGLEEYSYKR